MDREAVLSGILSDNHIEYTADKVEKLCRYFDMLIKKNEVMNLTAITDFEEASVKHFADSLSICRVTDISGKKVIDVGTGAGFPGLPLAIFYPTADFLLIDSLNKRIDFINEVIADLKLGNVTALHARAEELSRKPEYREQFDFAVSRAVANLSSLSEFCIPFIKVGGSFISYKGAKAEEEISALGKCAAILGGNTPRVNQYDLSDNASYHAFVIIKKLKATDSKYPRGGGKPLKNPLK